MFNGKTICIVGAGVTGLTIGFEILRRWPDCALTVLEKKPSVGGLAGGFQINGTSLEYTYHHVFASDKSVIRLCCELGIEQDLRWCASRSGVYASGKVWPLATSLDFLGCKPMGSLTGRLRMGLALRKLAKAEAWEPYDRLTCAEYFADRKCPDGYRRFWGPLLRHKYGKVWDKVPASFLWGRIRPRVGSRSWGKERLGYLRGGFQQMNQALADGIIARGGTIRLNAAAEAVQPGQRQRVTVAGKGFEYDRTIWTAAPQVLAQCGEGITETASDRLRAVDYLSVSCLVLALRRRLGDFYWINSIDDDTSFGIVVEHTNLVPSQWYGGKTILYVANYVRADSRFLNLDADHLLEAHLPSLRKLYPAFARRDVLSARAFSEQHASPLYDMGFHDRIPPYRGTLQGVDIVGMSQVYPEDRSMNNCIRNALRYVNALNAGTETSSPANTGMDTACSRRMAI